MYNQEYSNFIINNNKKLVNINIKNLLNQKIIIPNEQRIRDDNKVDEIIKYQDKFYKSGKNSFNFLGCINIHYCEEDGKNYLVDGQHRFKAMDKLYKEHHYNNFNVLIEIVKVNNKNELIENYKIINKNTELPEFPDNINKNLVENVCKYFFSEYPDIWTLKKKTIRPKLNKNQFQEAVAFLYMKLTESNINIEDEEDLKKIIIIKNEEMSRWSKEAYEKQIRKLKKLNIYLEECCKHNMYLGMYNFINETYCYDWIKDIIKQKTGELIKKEKKKRKKSIPKNLRKQVWKTYNKEESSAFCYCCKINKLDYMDSWECGHIISEFNGGNSTINNLRPICGSCNKSMGTQNMNLFMEKYYNIPKKNKKEKNKNKKKSWSFF